MTGLSKAEHIAELPSKISKQQNLCLKSLCVNEIVKKRERERKRESDFHTIRDTIRAFQAFASEITSKLHLLVKQ